MSEPTICQMGGFWVLGIQERAKPMEVDYEAFWRRFEERASEVRPLAIEPVAYDVYFPTNEEGLDDVFGGMPVPAGAERRTTRPAP